MKTLIVILICLVLTVATQAEWVSALQVTMLVPGGFYGQELDRSSGILVKYANVMPPIGEMVIVRYHIATEDGKKVAIPVAEASGVERLGSIAEPMAMSTSPSNLSFVLLQDLYLSVIGLVTQTEQNAFFIGQSKFTLDDRVIMPEVGNTVKADGVLAFAGQSPSVLCNSCIVILSDD